MEYWVAERAIEINVHKAFPHFGRDIATAVALVILVNAITN
jgi:hypothetical protein